MYVSVVVLISCCMSISMSCREKRCRVGAPLSRLFNCYYLLVKRDYVMRSSSKLPRPSQIEDVRIWNQLSSLIWTVLIICTAGLELRSLTDFPLLTRSSALISFLPALLWQDYLVMYCTCRRQSEVSYGTHVMPLFCSMISSHSFKFFEQIMLLCMSNMYSVRKAY